MCSGYVPPCPVAREDPKCRTIDAPSSMGVCRKAMTGVQARVRINGPVYAGASAVMAAVDALAALLTGDRQFFWDKGSTMTAQQREAAARKGEGS